MLADTCRLPPVMEEEESKYIKLLLSSSILRMRSTDVCGVTRKILLRLLSIKYLEYKASYSYIGRSGTITPSTPTSVAFLQKSSTPNCTMGFTSVSYTHLRAHET